MDITETRVPVEGHYAPMAERRGKPETFTPEQQGALREALRGWAQERAAERGGRVPQAEVGEAVGLSQQTVQKFLAVGSTAGVGYPTATRIAWLVNCQGVDEFFESRGLAPARPARPALKVLPPGPTPSIARYAELGDELREFMAATLRRLDSLEERQRAAEDMAGEALRAAKDGGSETVKVRRSPAARSRRSPR